jgi:hypothetical protein
VEKLEGHCGRAAEGCHCSDEEPWCGCICVGCCNMGRARRSPMTDQEKKKEKERDEWVKRLKDEQETWRQEANRMRAAEAKVQWGAPSCARSSWRTRRNSARD